jgi:hypothetical protein
MKYFLIFSFFVIASSACNNSKNVTSTKTNPYWKQVTSEETPYKYSAFVIFRLDEKAFLEALENGTVTLPDDLGNLNYFTIEESNTMSAELAEKFPDIKSYKGTQIDNSLCKPRIEKSKTKIKISVLCNDKTYFIDKDKDLGFYILYNKENAPKGTGTVNEK